MITQPKRGRPPGPVPFKPAAPGAEFLTVGQAAHSLQRSTKTIQRYIRTGKLSASQIVPGGPYLIAAVAIQKMLEASTTNLHK